MKKCEKVPHDIDFLQFPSEKPKNTFDGTSKNRKNTMKKHGCSLIFQNFFFNDFSSSPTFGALFRSEMVPDHQLLMKKSLQGAQGAP
jgi:hypothetical protein